VFADLARMPHLLVAGTTGSGKSVGVNSMILSLLYRLSPEQCRFLMIDPKMLELSVYNGIPHLLAPVVTDAHKAVFALNWVVREMEDRYRRMASIAVRNITAFNERLRAGERGEDAGLEPMPYIVVVVDEFADLMVVAGREIEAAVQRLAQMARAAGIHLIMATQRPSVDIITGTIKANFPTRISFKVASKIDSRTILGEQGAEQLLGQGDMLFASGQGRMLRVHGPFVADEEVESSSAYLRALGRPRYVAGVTDMQQDGDAGDDGHSDKSDLYGRAVAIVLRDQKASTSYLQRRLSIGYNRAADLVERMEHEGIISAPDHQGRRQIRATP
jgi:S-DNA-T family DNA segregation ATPase FtsK/SpoIIIE